ncbi:class I adenylate-forming enzyme family protein [Embleya sp. NPDC050154]|uniref:class I adenylate-forming enzyme family protein n=1 Tax=Embleya sp. NPDC050154 TaxID=3363988 RepID=UPI00379EE5A5
MSPHQQPMPIGKGRRDCRTMVDALRDAVAVAPERVALRHGDRTLTYGQYGRCVAGLARLLGGFDVSGTRVALVLPNGPEMAVCVFAGLAAQAQVTFINPAYPAPAMRPLLDDAAPSVVITTAEVSDTARDLAAEYDIPVLEFGTEGLALDLWADDTTLSLDDLRRPSPDRLATLMYTGGTTGIPKGVDHTHANLLMTVQAMEACWPTDPGTETWLTVAPMFHIWGLLMGVLNPVYGRAEVISFARFDPPAVVESMHRYGVSVFSGGPAAVYAGLLSAPRLRTADLSRLRVCPGGGSPFPLELLARWHHVTGVPVREAFGMTELAPISCNPSASEPRPGSVGLPAPLVQIRITDALDADVPVGEIGQVLARAPHMLRGYRNRPEETAQALAGGWLHTGDLGRFDEDGYLHIVDRIKDMILVGGFNVYPREIDEVLMAHPTVEESVTIGVADERKGERPVTFVAFAEGAGEDIEELHRLCRDQLPAYKRPAEILGVEAIPHTAANKVNRPRLREMWTQSRAEGRHETD